MIELDFFGRWLLSGGAVCMFLTAMVLSTGTRSRLAPLVWTVGLVLLVISAIGRL